jgi:hypothetical protein
MREEYKNVIGKPEGVTYETQTDGRTTPEWIPEKLSRKLWAGFVLTNNKHLFHYRSIGRRPGQPVKRDC